MVRYTAIYKRHKTRSYLHIPLPAHFVKPGAEEQKELRKNGFVYQSSIHTKDKK